jgi:hypothetical protein
MQNLSSSFSPHQIHSASSLLALEDNQIVLSFSIASSTCLYLRGSIQWLLIVKALAQWDNHRPRHRMPSFTSPMGLSCEKMQISGHGCREMRAQRLTFLFVYSILGTSVALRMKNRGTKDFLASNGTQTGPYNQHFDFFTCSERE